jgi:predicted cupin superfamily sugar epimerase
MQEEIRKLIDHYDLIEHPEGGFYSETYRSETDLVRVDRQLMTAIYFLLPSNQVSRFHRIKSDELWFFHAGSSLIVHTLDETGHTQHHLGNDISNGQQPQILVKANTIFGSTVKDEEGYAFVSCAVAPGFDFRDFELFKEDTLHAEFPDHADIIKHLT